MAQGHNFTIHVKHALSVELKASFQRVAATLEDSFNQTALVANELEAAKDQLRKSQQEKALLEAEVAKLRQEKARAPDVTGRPARAVEEKKDRQDVFELMGEMKDHTNCVHSVAFDSQSIGVLASASWDASVKLYNLMDSNKVVRSLNGADEPGEEKPQGLYSVAFAKLPAHSHLLGCTSCDHAVYMWDHQTGKLRHKFQKHTDEVNGLDFHSIQPVMATASDDCSVIIWDFLEGMVLRELTKHTKAVYGCRFMGGGEFQYLVTSCCFDMQTRIFDMRCRTVVATMSDHTDDVIGVDFSPARGLLATGSDDGKICVYDSRKWTLQQTIETRHVPALSTNEVKRVSFSPDGSLLAAAASTGRVLVYDVAAASNAKCIAQLTGHTDCVFDVAWQRNNKGYDFLASASHDQTVRYWRRRV